MKYFISQDFEIVDTNIYDINSIIDNSKYTTVQNDTIELTIKFSNNANKIALLNLKADFVDVQFAKNLDQASFYSKRFITVQKRAKNIIDYLNYPSTYQKSLLIDIPFFFGAIYAKITISSSSVSTLGKLILGKDEYFGTTLKDPAIDIIDFSNFDRQEALLTKDFSSKDISIIEQVDTKNLDNIIAKLESLAGGFGYFMFDDENLNILGRIVSANMIITNPIKTDLNIKIEGIL
jgi:hypothetical protein